MNSVPSGIATVLRKLDVHPARFCGAVGARDASPAPSVGPWVAVVVPG